MQKKRAYFYHVTIRLKCATEIGISSHLCDTTAHMPSYPERTAEGLRNVSGFSLNYYQDCHAVSVSLVIRCPLRTSAGKFARPSAPHRTPRHCSEAPRRLDNQRRREWK